MKNKHIRIAVFLLGLMMASVKAFAEPVLNVSAYSAELDDVTALGDVDVEGVGKVALTAKRHGSQVVVQAIGPGEVMMGRAETTVGLPETPVYIRTASGLKKVTVFWGIVDE